MKCTAATVAMIREQADHPNSEGYGEIDPPALRLIADDLESMLAVQPAQPALRLLADGLAVAQPKAGALIVGARVRWSSQSNGSRTTKTGAITEVIASKTRPRSTRVGQFGMPRDHVSYLVRGDNGRLYWPRVSTLEVVS